MRYLDVLLLHNRAAHLKQSVGRRVKNGQSQMYFDVYTPTAKNLSQYELEGDHDGQCKSFQRPLDARDETGPKPPHTADVCPSALRQDCGKELITLWPQKHLRSV